MAETRSIKGVVILSRLDFVRERNGEAGLERVMGRLSPADQQFLQTTLLPSAWYPHETGERLDRAIADELGGSDVVFREMGASSAAHNLSDTHRVFVKAQNPHGLLKSAATIYRLYYDSGFRTYERTGERRAVLCTHDALVFSRLDCMTVIGWHERAIEMCGGAEARVTHPKCRAAGDSFCEYVCEWNQGGSVAE